MADIIPKFTAKNLVLWAIIGFLVGYVFRKTLATQTPLNTAYNFGSGQTIYPATAS